MNPPTPTHPHPPAPFRLVAQEIRENAITADYVSAALRRAGAVELECSDPSLKRLTHVQHICRYVCSQHVVRVVCGGEPSLQRLTHVQHTSVGMFLWLCVRPTVSPHHALLHIYSIYQLTQQQQQQQHCHG